MANAILNLDQALSQARRFEEAGQRQQAMRIYAAILQKLPGNKHAREAMLKLQTAPGGAPVTQAEMDRLKQFMDNKRWEQAEQAVMALLARAPKMAFLHNVLGIVLIEEKRHEEARHAFSKAVQIQPDFAEAYANLGNVLLHDESFEQALGAFDRALELKPDLFEGLDGKARVLAKMRWYYSAVDYFERALSKCPNAHETRYRYADVLLQIRRVDDAEANARMLLDVDPSARVWCLLAGSYRFAGREQDSKEAYANGLELDPKHCESLFGLAQTEKGAADSQLMSHMISLLADDETEEHEKCMLEFALGKSYEDLGDYDKAFAYYSAGNARRVPLLKGTTESELDLLERIRSVFPEDPGYELTPSESDLTPIFVLGMPRSGTTLTEQILASHSEVYGADELPFMSRSAKPLVDGLHEANRHSFPKDMARQLREDYLEHVRRVGFEEKIFVDKMPHNFMWIGPILKAFPEAKIVNTLRSPMAVCWSNFKLSFGSDGLAYCYNLVDTGRFYNAYATLMAHWNDLYGDRIYPLHYETLTENQEEESRKLLEFVGLDWEDRVLEFHKTKRPVRTGSSLQVRDEIYTGSSKAWRKFEEHLGPLIEELGSLAY